MSGKVLSLSRARKARLLDEKRAGAARNAARFGQTKAQKQLDKARADKARQRLDGHARET